MRHVLPSAFLLVASQSMAEISCIAFPLSIVDAGAGVSAPLQQRMSALRSAINEEVGAARADSVDQCAVLPLGARPCGGPSEYLAFSRQVSDPQKLATLAQSYSDAQREWNQASGIAGTCEFLLPPKLVLADGLCKTE